MIESFSLLKDRGLSILAVAYDFTSEIPPEKIEEARKKLSLEEGSELLSHLREVHHLEREAQQSSPPSVSFTSAEDDPSKPRHARIELRYGERVGLSVVVSSRKRNPDEIFNRNALDNYVLGNIA